MNLRYLIRHPPVHTCCTELWSAGRVCVWSLGGDTDALISFVRRCYKNGLLCSYITIHRHVSVASATSISVSPKSTNSVQIIVQNI